MFFVKNIRCDVERNVAAALTHAVAALEISPGGKSTQLKRWKTGEIGEMISGDPENP